MAQGGARIRSGPKADPNSARSEARGYKLAALPASGYKGEAPEFPLLYPTERELELWAWAWTTPQACAWSLPSQEWRQPTIAMWVRMLASAEVAPKAPLLAHLHRFADQIGMTSAGLAEMGWAISDDGEVAAETPAERPAPKSSSRARLTVVADERSA